MSRKVRVASTLSFVLTATALIGVPIASSARKGPESAGGSVSVKGLRIVARPDNDDQNMRAFNYFAGTAIAIQASVPGGGLVRIDDDGSTLDEFRDDLGTDLLRREPTSFGSFGVGAFPSFSGDGTAALVEISAPRPPASGATRIHARGTLVFHQAFRMKSFTERVRLEEGVTIGASVIPLSIVKVGRPDWGDEPLQVTLRATESVDALARIHFAEAGGAAIQARDAGTMRTRVFDRARVDRSFALERRVSTVNVTVDYWDGLKKVTVPFDIRTSVGID